MDRNIKETESYSAPVCEVTEMQTEGVILTPSDSYGGATHEGFEEDTDYGSIWD